MINTFQGHIDRETYSRRIEPFIGQRLIKVLVGQRRAGKSHVLYQIMEDIRRGNAGANIIYINTEFAEYQFLTRQEDLYSTVAARLRPEANYVFIDEIQEIAAFERAVQALYAEGRCDIYITGSNSHLLSGELATYLAGRYVQFHIHPLSYQEFLLFYHLENTNDALRKYLETGGMPYLAALAPLVQSETLADQYLRDLYQSILLRDVVSRANIRNTRFLENLAVYIADNTGSLFSATNINKYLKNQKTDIPVPTIISYLSALEKAMLIHRVPRKDIKGLKVFEIGEKYYFEDIGIRNTLTRRRFPADMEKQIENAVYLYLIQQGWTVYVGQMDSAEVDFAAEKQGNKIYVQAAWRLDAKETQRREFGGLEQIRDQFPKYVVHFDDYTPDISPAGIRCMHLKDFLTAEL